MLQLIVLYNKDNSFSFAGQNSKHKHYSVGTEFMVIA
jgi:hypothetical protein